jgi:DNA-binding NarL/FixJ family response regulator
MGASTELARTYRWMLNALVDDFAPFRLALRQILEEHTDYTVVGEAGDGKAGA